MPEALAAELGAQVGRPQPLPPHLFLQRVDRLTPLALERGELQVWEDEVERLDLFPDERVGPVELLLVFGIGFEVPHGASLGLVQEYDSGYQERNT